MKVWDVVIEEVSSKDDPDYWESYGTFTVIADTVQEACEKALEYAKLDEDFFAWRVTKAELVREVDVP